MTWGDLKLLALQKVFAVSDGRLVEDSSTQEYTTAMPGAANEGLQLLATAGRFIKKRLEITQDGIGAGPVCKYELPRLADDFYSLDSDGVYFQGTGEYRKDADWSMEAGEVFVLPAGRAGTWTLWYNAYPPELTSGTEDGYELPLYPEVAALLPLYMASQIYKDDELGMAVQYRNEFEVGREALLGTAARQSPGGRDSWRCTTGWWSF